MTDTRTDLQEAVARGAQWLDTQNPDWYNRINVELLNLSSSTHCVAGQLFNDQAGTMMTAYGTVLANGYAIMKHLAANALKRDPYMIDVYLGFTDSEHNYVNGDEEPENLRPLRDLWLAEITRRKAEESRDQT